jgi:hypothetical protein
MAGQLSKRQFTGCWLSPRWSLRSLLLFVTLSALASRFVAGEYFAYQTEQRALAALNQFGTVSVEHPYKSFPYKSLL